MNNYKGDQATKALFQLLFKRQDEQNEKIASQSNQIQTLLGSIDALVSKMDNLTSKLTETVKSQNVVDVILEMEGEREAQQSKAANFVIYGLKEGMGRTDKEIVDEVFVKSGVRPEVVTEVFRLPRREGGRFPALVKVKTSDVVAKKVVMRKQREVLESVKEFAACKQNPGCGSVYLRNDLTRKQLEKHGELVRERNALNAALPVGCDYKWSVRDMRLVRNRAFRA